MKLFLSARIRVICVVRVLFFLHSILILNSRLFSKPDRFLGQYGFHVMVELHSRTWKDGWKCIHQIPNRCFVR